MGEIEVILLTVIHLTGKPSILCYYQFMLKLSEAMEIGERNKKLVDSVLQKESVSADHARALLSNLSLHLIGYERLMQRITAKKLHDKGLTPYQVHKRRVVLAEFDGKTAEGVASTEVDGETVYKSFCISIKGESDDKYKGETQVGKITRQLCPI